MYAVAVKIVKKYHLHGLRATGLPGGLGPGYFLRGCWPSLCKPPIDKCLADIKWRIIHRFTGRDTCLTLIKQGLQSIPVEADKNCNVEDQET